MNLDLATRRRIVIVLGCLTGMGAVSVDMSLPSIPAMVSDLATSLPVGQQVVGVFMLGIAIGQLPAGLLSDRIGRVPVLMTGVLIFTAAGVVTTVAPSIEIMLLARFVQGLGSSVGVVVSRAVVRDIASGEQAARLLSVMVMIFTAAPMLAPVVGGYLVSAFDWRAPFAAVTLFGAMMLFAVTRSLQETRRPNRDHHIMRQLSLAGREFFSHRRSVLGLALVVLPAMGFMSVITGSSTLIIEIYGFSETAFGYIFALTGVGILVGSVLNRRLLVRFNTMQMAGLGAVLIGVAALQLLIITQLQQPNFWWLWANVCLYMCGVSFLMANATAMSLDPVPDIAGAASSIIGTIQNLFASTSAITAGLIYDGSVGRSVILMGVFGTATLVMFLCRRVVLGRSSAPADGA